MVIKKLEDSIKIIEQGREDLKQPNFTEEERGKKGRRLSIAITKIEEAIMWINGNQE